MNEQPRPEFVKELQAHYDDKTEWVIVEITIGDPHDRDQQNYLKERYKTTCTDRDEILQRYYRKCETEYKTGDDILAFIEENMGQAEVEFFAVNEMESI